MHLSDSTWKWGARLCEALVQNGAPLMAGTKGASQQIGHSAAFLPL